MHLLLLAALIFPVALLAAETPPEKKPEKLFGGKERMNGYALSDYPDFWKKWHFVTVRYRRDTGEMRLTYANDIAWKALLAGGTDYPEGAIFSKIGLMTQDDPAFTSSAVPSGAQRYQLMVKNKKKHAGTDGWGYALFDASGKTFNEDPKVQEEACHACHELVPERDYVFSQPMHLALGKMDILTPPAAGLPEKRISFSIWKVKDLPEKIRKSIPAHFAEARMLDGILREKMFQGTIDEIRPTLMREAAGSKNPVLLLSTDGQRFSMVMPEKDSDPCTTHDGKKGIGLVAVYTTRPGEKAEYPVKSMNVCEAAP
jgi:hypothetical protein